jgi:hypothetical protein
MPRKRSDQERLIYWHVTERMRSVWIAGATRKAAGRFQAEGGAVAAAYEEGGEIHALEVIRRQQGAWLNVISRIDTPIAQNFAEHTAKLIREHEAKFTTLEQTNQLITQWIASEGLKKAVEISQTTREGIAKLLGEGVEKGLSIPNMVKSIRKEYSDFSKYRATRIARTEVISASNFGADAGAISTGLDLDKEWLATPGLRTRPAHQAANKQVRHMSESFSVAGEKLKWPGDRSLGASASNIINCRCTQAYLTKD